MKELKNRLLLSAVAVIIVSALILFSLYNVTMFVLVLLIATMAAGAMGEFIKLVKAKGITLQLPLLSIGAIGIVGGFYLASKFPALTPLPAFLLFIWVLLLFYSYKRKIQDSLVKISVSVFSLLYIAMPLGMLFPILTFGPQGDGRMWMAFLLIVTKITDIGAYFGGKLFGKRKLAPKLSPNKTLEGLIIGVFLALIVSVLFALFARDQFFSSIDLIPLGLVLAIAGQMGDLFESLFKRDAEVKDSSKLPGLGGLLDMLDSLFFTIPILYFYLYF